MFLPKKSPLNRTVLPPTAALRKPETFLVNSLSGAPGPLEKTGTGITKVRETPRFIFFNPPPPWKFEFPIKKLGPCYSDGPFFYLE